MLDPKTTDALRVLVDRLKIERSAIDEVVAAVENLLTLYAEPITTVDRLRDRNAAAPPSLRAKDHAPKRGLPKERPGERRCSKCRGLGHTITTCQEIDPVERDDELDHEDNDATDPVHRVEDRVCAVHEAPATEVGKRKLNGRQVYTCPLGCETENTIVRRKATA